jgi:hypothetical protein
MLVDGKSSSSESVGPPVYVPWRVASPFMANVQVFHVSTDADRALRALPSPDAPRVTELVEGAPLAWTGGETRVDGQAWRLMRTEAGAEGWIAVDALRAPDDAE